LLKRVMFAGIVCVTFASTRGACAHSTRTHLWPRMFLAPRFFSTVPLANDVMSFPLGEGVSRSLRLSPGARPVTS
jgi:hypothetical protein